MLLHFKTEIDFNNMYSNCNPGGLGSQKLWSFLIGLIPKGKLKRAHHKYRIIYIMLKKIYLYVLNLSFICVLQLCLQSLILVCAGYLLRH